MVSIQKYAAIDIGSNAIRLLISNVIEQEDGPTLFRKNALVRVPVRLGEDVFTKGEISEENKTRMRDALNAFQLLMSIHKVKHYRACATSAMREAVNGHAFAKALKEKTNINIEIIDGEEEAAIIAATDLHSFIKKDITYLYIDVGGGSTEFSIYHKGKVIKSKSFKIGTVRLLKGNLRNDIWITIEKWIKDSAKCFESVQLLGTGGNINKIFKLSGLKIGKPLTYLDLLGYYEKLSSFTYEDRITKLSLNPDRADVIIPALEIYLKSMKWSNAKHLYVPKVGLSDGIIKHLYQSRNC